MPPGISSQMTDDAPQDQTHSKRILRQLGPVGIVGAASFAVFLLFILVNLFLLDEADRYTFLKTTHYWVSRGGLAVAALMLVLAIYIGLIRHGDVTPWFRRITYTIVAFMMTQGGMGGLMYLMGGRPGEDVHLIYGYGVVLSLPFFIFVEVTAKKRPAMGSYIWGFTMLAAIIVRCISTGPPA